jgi:hypothetical protein
MHLSFDVDDMDATLQRLKEIGIKPEGEPIILQEEDGTTLELIAPMGHSKETIRNNKPILEGQNHTGLPNRLSIIPASLLKN